jgi:hypothetical protein
MKTEMLLVIVLCILTIVNMYRPALLMHNHFLDERFPRIDIYLIHIHSVAKNRPCGRFFPSVSLEVQVYHLRPPPETEGFPVPSKPTQIHSINSWRRSYDRVSEPKCCACTGISERTLDRTTSRSECPYFPLTSIIAITMLNCRVRRSQVCQCKRRPCGRPFYALSISNMTLYLQRELHQAL